MPTREEKIKVINKVIANKELSFGCRFKLKSGAITIATGLQSGIWITCLYFQQTRIENIDEIIGHPVMFGDLYDYLDNLIEEELTDIIIKYDVPSIFDKWKQKRLPIEEQSDECIDFIYNLISE